MKNKYQKTSLKISKDVIETIATISAVETEGVKEVVSPAIGTKSFFSNVMNKNSVEISMVHGVAEISIGLILNSDSNVLEVSTSVQKKIKDNIQNMTGIVVPKVNIYVEDVQFENKELAEESELKIDQIEATSKEN